MGGGASKTKTSQEPIIVAHNHVIIPSQTILERERDSPSSSSQSPSQSQSQSQSRSQPHSQSPLRPMMIVDTAPLASASSPPRQSQGESPYSRPSDFESPYSRPSNMSPRERSESEEFSPNEQEEENLRMHFAQSAMSLGMDNDDLIFNLLYFGDNTTTFQSMFNTAVEETVAAHSAGNTPYKLHPATEEALESLKVLIMTADTIVDQNECTICQEDLEIGQEIVFMPDCHHSFHNECVQRWFRLQSWCPVCRTEIISHSQSTHATSTTQPRKGSHGWKTNLNTSFEAVDEDMEYSEHREAHEAKYQSDSEEEMEPPSRSLVSDSSVESLMARQTVQMVMEKSMAKV